MQEQLQKIQLNTITSKSLFAIANENSKNNIVSDKESKVLQHRASLISQLQN